MEIKKLKWKKLYDDTYSANTTIGPIFIEQETWTNKYYFVYEPKEYNSPYYKTFEIAKEKAQMYFEKIIKGCIVK